MKESEGRGSYLKEVSTRNHLPQLGVATLVTMVCGAVGFLFTESHQLRGDGFQHVLDAMWWSFVTMTTIGYGDIVPQTASGRLVGSLVGISGVIFLSLITAVLASILVERKIMEDKGLTQIKARDHRVVCGWNSHAENVLIGLARQAPRSMVVLVSDISDELFADLKYRFRGKLDMRFVKGDYTQESVLEKACVSRAASCILVVDTAGEHDILSSDERAIKGTLTIKAMAAKVRVCVELLDRHSQPHLLRAKADEIQVRGEYTGMFLSGAACSPGITTVMEELIGPTSGVQLESLEIPRQFIDKSFGELAEHLCLKQKCTAIGLQEQVQDLKVDDLLSDDLSMVDQFIRKKFMESGTGLEERLSTSRPLLNPSPDHTIQDNSRVLVLKTVTGT
jgi:voltage-gated potassium channel